MYKYERAENFDFSKLIDSSKKNPKKQTFDAMKFLLICLILVASMVTISIAINVFDKSENNTSFVDYDHFIWPVVMQNPKSFDEDHPIDSTSMISAAVWKSSMDFKSDLKRFNEDQKLVLSLDEVKKACFELFGKDFAQSDIVAVKNNFFEFDFQKNEFLVDSVSGVENYFPRTVNAYHSGDEMILKVGYVVPAESFDRGMSTLFSDKVEKYEVYHLKINKNSGNMYISSLE